MKPYEIKVHDPWEDRVAHLAQRKLIEYLNFTGGWQMVDISGYKAKYWTIDQDTWHQLLKDFGIEK